MFKKLNKTQEIKLSFMKIYYFYVKKTHPTSLLIKEIKGQVSIK